MNRNLRLSLAIALALGSPAAMALGLGGISVKSELNQPLAAEIPVYVSSPQEAETLAVRLASGEEFSRVGLNIGEISVPIMFEVGKNARGEPVIQVSSAEAIREPFVTFLVEVNWANGRLLREYSVLLEPPISSPAAAIPGPAPALPEPTALPAPTPIAEAPVTEPEPIAPATEPAPEPVAEPAPVETPTPVEPEPVAEVPSETVPIESPTEPIAETAPEPAPTETPIDYSYVDNTETAAPASAAPGEYGPIAAGETLWEIASTTRPNEAVTLNQMMLALLRANPDAFFQDNVNALKRGAVLRIPGADELVSTPVSEAAAEILSQNQSWIASTRTSTVADADAGSSYRNTSGNGSTGTGGSRVELVPPSSGDRSSQDRPGVSGGTGDSQALRQELSRTKEDLASKSRDNQELSSRVRELEKINSDSERLANIANSRIAALEDQLAKAQAAREAAEKAARDKPVTPTPVEPTTPDPIAAEPPVETTPEPIADPVTTDPVTATDPDATTEPVADPTAVDGSTDGTSETTDPDASEPDAEPTPVPLAEEPAATSTPPDTTATEEQPIYMNPMVWGGALVALVLALLAFLGLRRKKAPAAAGIQQSSLARSPLSDAFAGGIAGGASAATGDPEEGRMLAELARDPTDLNAHLSLLEHYYTSRNIDKFEAQAEAMYAQVPSTDSQEWQGAVLMGRDLCPSHPLFDEGGASSPSMGGGIGDPFSLTGFEARDSAPPQRDQFGFDVSPPKPAAPPQVPPTLNESFDFNLLDRQNKAPAVKDELDLGFDLDQMSAVAPKNIDVPSIEMPTFNLETERTAPPTSATIEMPRVSDEFLGDDAVATKLDLARAYLDMGDSDGAKSMLDEVITEGNDKQKDEARKLLAEIR